MHQGDRLLNLPSLPHVMLPSKDSLAHHPFRLMSMALEESVSFLLPDNKSSVVHGFLFFALAARRLGATFSILTPSCHISLPGSATSLSPFQEIFIPSFSSKYIVAHDLVLQRRIWCVLRENSNV